MPFLCIVSIYPSYYLCMYLYNSIVWNMDGDNSCCVSLTIYLSSIYICTWIAALCGTWMVTTLVGSLSLSFYLSIYLSILHNSIMWNMDGDNSCWVPLTIYLSIYLYMYLYSSIMWNMDCHNSCWVPLTIILSRTKHAFYPHFATNYFVIN